MIKCSRLIAALAFVMFIVFHFNTSNNSQNDEVASAPTPDGDETYVSMYENFDKQSSLSQENLSSSSNEISPSETNSEYDELALAVELGTSTEITYDDEIPQLYDTLYEEVLPDDIIDFDHPEVNTKHKNISVPAQKPAYFGKNPLIAIVIDDMGINHRRTAEISSLNYPLTASFLTYGTNIDEQVNHSQTSGHEIMLHAPMEALSTTENAPDVLTTAMSAQEIKDNFSVMLQKVKNIKGVNNHMGSKLTQDKEKMLAVMEVIKEHNLFFLDSRTSAKSVADKAAQEMKVKYATRNIFLDNNNDKNYILKQLEHTENLARKNGYAIAIGHPKSQTVAALQEWLPSLQNKGIKLVHLSEIINILNQ